jgi:outer membrane immunogenic protein
MMKMKTTIAMAFAAAFVATPVLAADLAMKAPVPIVPAWSWAGWYAGVNLGYSIGDTSIIENSSSPAAGVALISNSVTTNANGLIGGGQIGYNWQTTPNWLFGVETDFQGSGQKHTSQFSLLVGIPATDTIGVDLDWFGTARARVGYIVNNSNLWYVTGGYAYGQTKLAFSSTNAIIPGGITASGDIDKTMSGWTLGGGLESRLFGNWTAKLEYLYVDLGTIGGTASAIVPLNPPIAAISASARIRDNIVRGGLNYKF